MIKWESKLFKDIAQFPPKIIMEKGKTYSFIPMEDISGNYKYVVPTTEKVWNGSGGAKFENGDTLFARITPCLQNGKIAQVKDLKDGKGFGSTEYFIFRGIDKVSDSDFIYYFAQTEEFKKHAIGSMVGASGRQRADAKFVGNFELNCPPLVTQRKIASILTTYDDLIDNNLKRIKLLYNLAELQYFEFKNNAKKVKEYELQEIADYIGRGVTPNYEDGSGFWAINQKANKGMFLEEQHFKEYKKGDWVPPEKFAKNGDVIINSLGEGTIGRCHFYKWEDDIYPIDQHMSIFRGKSKAISLFVFQYLSSDEGQGMLYSLKKGGTNMTMLNINDLRSLKLILPSEGDLMKYYSVVESLFAQKATLEKQNRLLKASRDILLPKLMSGEIEVK